jgi:hypothetical protein
MENQNMAEIVETILSSINPNEQSIDYIMDFSTADLHLNFSLN